jgi:hypothetical protein
MYSITWTPNAFELMSRIISAMPERRHLLAADLRRIATELHNNPTAVGESREESRRVWFVGNLLLSYDVVEDDLDVVIQSVQFLPNR